jgi:hypothetical protein
MKPCPTGGCCAMGNNGNFLLSAVFLLFCCSFHSCGLFVTPIEIPCLCACVKRAKQWSNYRKHIKWFASVIMQQWCLTSLPHFHPLFKIKLWPSWSAIYIKQCDNCQLHTQASQALRVPEGSDSRISRQVVFLELISVRGWVDPRATVRPEWLWK